MIGMKKVPISPYQKTLGMCYFPRMLNKIRLFAAGELREDFHDFLGDGLDGRCCGFLKVSYDEVKEKALGDLSDEAILKWCFEAGRVLDDNDLVIWNHFLTKLGWRDHATERVDARKAEGGLEGRDDIISMVEFMEIDEGRELPQAPDQIISALV